MRRREFIGILAGTAASWATASRAAISNADDWVPQWRDGCLRQPKRSG